MQTAAATGQRSPEPSDAPAVQHDADGYDEVHQGDEVREPYVGVMSVLEGLGASGLQARRERLATLEEQAGLVFRVLDETESHVFPVDLVPRLVSAEDWAHISSGAEQRVRALDAFLQDVYGQQRIVADGIVPAGVLDRAPGYRATGRVQTQGVRAHVSGLDLVTSAPGKWHVLEDNLRVPAGTHYARIIRQVMRETLPELDWPDLVDPSDVCALLLDTLSAAAPAGHAERDEIIVLSAGPSDSAWAEHAGLAEGMGVQVLTTDQLWFEGGELVRSLDGKTAPVRVVYLRLDEDLLLAATGQDGEPLGRKVLDAVLRNRLRLANALGNGVGDDKAIYHYVPEMIRYYLDEEPILEQVPTWLCAEPDQSQEVLDRVGELVTKPIDGYGGQGVVIGPDATPEQLDERRRELEEHPELFVAQEVVPLSTHPAAEGGGLEPRHVDLRVFVHLRDQDGSTRAFTLPAALSRVGPAGSRVVNASSGGGSKDTWILTADESGDGTR